MFEIPRGALYPVLPLRDIVVFPHMIVPLFVGREKSVRALEDVMKDDKQILLVGTTDGWATKFEVPLTWAEDFPWSAGRERWHLELDRAGDFDVFEYAFVYRHGVVNGARTYEFWDNNFGANYRVEATPVVE